MDVFSAFSQAIVSGIWELGRVKRATEIGDTYTPVKALDVIVEEASDGELRNSPDADGITSDTLIYAKPSQLPTLNSAALIGDHLLKNTENEQYYAIIGADIGKNQENGTIEHVELWVRATEALEDGE